VFFGDFVESQQKDFNDPIDEEGSAEDYGYLSDSDLEDDEDVKCARQAAVSGPPVIPGSGDTAYENRKECIERGRVVKIPDVAFVT
jgi:hypothetical protein